MTKEEFKFLEGYETYFQTAVYSDYSRNLPQSVLERMVSIYDKEKGVQTHLQYTCGGCQLTFLKRIGKLYFDLKVVKELEPNKKTNKLDKEATKNGKGKGKNKK